LFNFGVIADIQYVDAPDAMNFQGTMMRRYRQSLNIFQEAINSWTSLKPKPACAIVLGDILDGKTASMNNQYDCLSKILKATQKASFDVHYCFGNHCHYSLRRQELFENFLPHFQDDEDRSGGPVGGLCSAEKLYYDFSPCKQWRFVSLDSYDISLIGASCEENKEIAAKWLAENNPNDLSVSGGWFTGLPFEKKRWVPYNGGVSMKQLKWLDGVLEKSKQRNEKVVIFCHQPVWSPDKPNSVIWNSEDILKILWKYDNVFMWIAGHDHDGQVRMLGHCILCTVHR
jgi:manganese-dependent ADP-ribose/CDP-alcohol diphosphatase